MTFRTLLALCFFSACQAFAMDDEIELGQITIAFKSQKNTDGLEHNISDPWIEEAARQILEMVRNSGEISEALNRICHDDPSSSSKGKGEDQNQTIKKQQFEFIFLYELDKNIQQTDYEKLNKIYKRFHPNKKEEEQKLYKKKQDISLGFMVLSFFGGGLSLGVLMPGIFGHTEWQQIAGGVGVAAGVIIFIVATICYCCYDAKITAIIEWSGLPKSDLGTTKQKIYECACSIYAAPKAKQQ